MTTFSKSRHEFKANQVDNSKIPQKERVVLRAAQEVDLKGYAVVDRTFDPKGKVSNEFRHIFVFPSLTVLKGEWVLLYSGKGKYSKVKLASIKDPIHRLFWGSDHCVWNDAGGDTATLIRYAVLKSVPVPPVAAK